MGYNYGHKRGRMEPLRVPGIVAAAIGENNLRFSHADDYEYYDLVNERLDRVDRRLQSLD